VLAPIKIIPLIKDKKLVYYILKNKIKTISTEIGDLKYKKSYKIFFKYYYY
jgi:hypothetical protein